jgi:hypothetical protein
MMLLDFFEKADPVAEGPARFFNHHGQPRSDMAVVIPTSP